ncbi:MAG: preprotein translocase subunit SecA [Clostridia bacterium]|nr:preprotein translocase subunit SecA [Clostridia bacterium]
MMFNIFASDNTRNVKKLDAMAREVEALEPKYQKMSNEELQSQTQVLKDRLSKGETLDDILYDAFAVAREASSRVLNMKHFHVQIMGGIALHQGRIAEMRTGEGKTLVSTLPAYLNALSGKGVHVVTVNEYLSQRDAEWMGKLHKFLGLTVGCSFSNMSMQEKQAAYNCDITYCTNNELGFDYLRDNMVTRAEQRTVRGYNFAIIDEVDSILIDEARTPLIISGRGFKSSEDYVKAQRFMKKLRRDEDYTIDEEKNKIHLTESGSEKAERFFGVESLSDVSCVELNQHIMNALRANFILKADSNYIVKDGEVVLVDEFTGRLMDGRRYSNGLHQAVEAKEGVQIKDENLTVATITLQNYFRMYKKLSGMTGTAKTEETEFNKIYGLDVVTIPPNLPLLRIDEPDIIYTTIEGKLRAVVDRVEEAHKNGQPVLIGTITIEKSEKLSKMLDARKIAHNVLNAKNHAREGEIVAQAGRYGAVTIATNMAGRGTDILLGGNAEYLAKAKMEKNGYTRPMIELATSFLPATTEDVQKAKDDYNKWYQEFKKDTDAEKQKVLEAGGLLIIGTERHESRRIDNQLRGRAGRQGDPGRSVFYISMEDDLVRLFGGDKLKKVTAFFRIDEDTPFQIKMLSKQIENAQKKVEANHYAARRYLLEYDDVMNKQRTIIYAERNKILDGEDVHAQILEMIPDLVNNALLSSIDIDKPSFEWDIDEINRSLEDKLYRKGTNFVTEEMLEDIIVEELRDKIVENIISNYEQKKEAVNKIGDIFGDIERTVLLHVVDDAWMKHIDAMSNLRQEVASLSYGNKDPIVAYKKESLDMFDDMITFIHENTCNVLLNRDINIRVSMPNRPQNKDLVAGKESANPQENTTTNKPVGSTGEAKTDKVCGRNDPCPCGSGKKYKNCCGKEE